MLSLLCYCCLTFAASRSGAISLEDVLKFVTGSGNEPVLGFSIQPTICFNGAMLSSIPTSNTCINKLTLPVGSIVPDNKEVGFSFFDYAFVNNYFGRV